MRRARRAGAVAGDIEALLEDYGVPLPTAAVRVLLADRGRPVTAEHLARVAAGERAEFLRTRQPPRLCSAIAPDGTLVAPRWWASGTWSPAHRILTDDALPLWRGRLAEGICSELIARRRPASPALAGLVHATLAHLGLADDLARLPDPTDWLEIRALVLDVLPGVMFAGDVSTDQQDAAATTLSSADLPAVDCYFGVSRSRRGT
jgi:hypothetical protein